MTKTDNEQVIREFFLAYKQHAYLRMHALMSPNVHFRDFAFDIKGQCVFAMWQWFCLPNKHRKEVEIPWFGDICAEGESVTARYRVFYTYGAARRPIDYVIRASFVVRNGRIVEHYDNGDIRVWSYQALGRLPSLVSWTSIFKCFIRWQAERKLSAFIARSKLA